MIRKLSFLFFVLTFSLHQPLEAGCGSCAADKRAVKGAFIKEIPSNGMVSGKALASCGMCNFDTSDRNCSLALKIGHDIYQVKNVDMDAQVDSHAKDGFCNVVRVVNVKGRIRNDKLYANSFSVQ